MKFLLGLRNDDCDIRLLYGWVSGLHCKLFFQNAKVSRQ
jgi:hypothetical protein